MDQVPFVVSLLLNPPDLHISNTSFEGQGDFDTVTLGPGLVVLHQEICDASGVVCPVVLCQDRLF